MGQSKKHALVIADVFERVSIATACYHRRWISADDFTRIINFEHGLSSSPETEIASSALVGALSKDSRFCNAEDIAGTLNGVFRKEYRPKVPKVVGEKKKRKVIHCFFVETTKGSGLPNSGNAWFDSVVQFKPLRFKSCVVADEKKRELAATLRELDANEAAKKTKVAAATKRSAIEKNAETPLLKRHQPDKLNSARSTPTHQPNEKYSPRLRASAELHYRSQ